MYSTIEQWQNSRIIIFHTYSAALGAYRRKFATPCLLLCYSFAQRLSLSLSSLLIVLVLPKPPPVRRSPFTALSLRIGIPLLFGSLYRKLPAVWTKPTKVSVNDCYTLQRIQINRQQVRDSTNVRTILIFPSDRRIPKPLSSNSKR